MKATWWGAGALLAALLCAPVEAAARDRWDRSGRRDRFGGRGDTFGVGYERGFREGAKHGKSDARRNRGFDFRHDDDYWEADNGYRSSYGPRHVYASAYRRGYEEGYREAYYAGRGHGRYDRRRYERRRYDPRDGAAYGVAHRHAGRDGWCYERHGRDDWDDDDLIYEIPRR